MKKVMLLAAMLAMVLAAAAPAFAQSVNAGDDVVVNDAGDVEYNAVCQNILGSIGDIDSGNTANAGADADASVGADDSAISVDNAAAADIAQESGVTIEQANECLNQTDLDGDGFVEVVELEKLGFVVTKAGVVVVKGSVSASASASASASSSASASASATATLPETGGASLFALGAGALLVAGGLVARRIVR